MSRGAAGIGGPPDGGPEPGPLGAVGRPGLAGPEPGRALSIRFNRDIAYTPSSAPRGRWRTPDDARLLVIARRTETCAEPPSDRHPLGPRAVRRRSPTRGEGCPGTPGPPCC